MSKAQVREEKDYSNKVIDAEPTILSRQISKTL